VWCAAGEANLPWYLAPGFPYDDREQVRDWTEVMRFVRATDPFHRLLTGHPTAINRYTARHATDDPGLLDFDMLQTPHGQGGAVPVTLKAVRASYAATPLMPVIDGEASYEMLNDSLPTKWTRRMFWLCMMNGAAGHTYGANGIWQCNRPGQPHGPSPHGGSYGVLPWNEAMHLPGSRQVGLAKALLEQYPWHRFEPHPEWAVSKPEAGAGQLNDAFFEPQAAGIPGLVRIIYVPENQAIEARGLGPQARYAAAYFDPVSGGKASLGNVQADSRGVWSCRAPPGQDHDWVLVLENLRPGPGPSEELGAGPK
jgi:hypothetical protein